jgi:hypothetical protein
MPATDAVLTQILAQLEAMQLNQQAMQAKACRSLLLGAPDLMNASLMR